MYLQRREMKEKYFRRGVDTHSIMVCIIKKKGAEPMGNKYGRPYDPDNDEYSPDDFESDYWESDGPDFERMEIEALDEQMTAQAEWEASIEAMEW